MFQEETGESAQLRAEVEALRRRFKSHEIERHEVQEVLQLYVSHILIWCTLDLLLGILWICYLCNL